MSERGVFAVDRGIWDHPAFAPEAFTEREAAMWLFGAAAWKPKRVRVGKVQVDLARGQCAFATRFMAERWRWSEARVRRFLNRLTSDAVVTIQTTRQATLITICKYDEYQFGRRTDDEPSDAQDDAESTHKRRKEEERKEDKKEEITPSLRSGVSRAGRGARLPDDWQPSLDELAFARSLLPEPQVSKEAAKFRDYWHARAGPQAVKRDWTATWRNWIRTAAERNPANGQGPNGKRTVQQAAADLLDRVRAFDEPAPAYLRDGTGQADVRLLPPGRRE
jgi:hypothetical protein